MRTLLLALMALPLFGQANLDFLNHNRPVLDAHNCYPYKGDFRDRIDRALATGFPVGIEQDLAWAIDPATGKGRPVVTHTAKTTSSGTVSGPCSPPNPTWKWWENPPTRWMPSRCRGKRGPTSFSWILAWPA